MYIKNCFIAYTVNNVRKECIFDKSFDNADMEITLQAWEQDEGKRLILGIAPKLKVEINTLYIEMNENLSTADSVYLNGYQTWTESREFNLNEKIPKLNRLANPIMSMYGDYEFAGINRENLISWTYTYIRNSDRIALLGSLSEASGYTVFEYDRKNILRIVKDCSGLIINGKYEAFDIFTAEGDENNCFDNYFKAMKLPKPRVKYCTGWTSWYNYYTKITEEIILQNLNAFKSKKIPIDIFQIDDGYQEAIGDWLDVNAKFPRGMRFIADEIKKCGFKAGIWLAPFICDKQSKIYKAHPEWVVKKAGFNPGWSGNFYVLDIYNEEVRNYIKKVFRVVFNEWNYDMVKLDFLYAAALIERKDKTRGQIMYEAVKFLREISGDKIILGCGVPLGCAFGLVDYCRIGSDAALKWEDKFLKSLHYRERVSTINSITSTVGRRHLNGLAFFNDPDVFIIRSRNNKLTQKQRYTLLLINLILGGLVFTSDNLDEYTDEEMKLYKSIFPVKEKTIERVVNDEVLKIYFSIEDNRYIALCNLQEKGISLNIEGNCFRREGGFVRKDTSIYLEPYESVCLLKCETDMKEFKNTSNIFML